MQEEWQLERSRRTLSETGGGHDMAHARATDFERKEETEEDELSVKRKEDNSVWSRRSTASFDVAGKDESSWGGEECYEERFTAGEGDQKKRSRSTIGVFEGGGTRENRYGNSETGEWRHPRGGVNADTKRVD